MKTGPEIIERLRFIQDRDPFGLIAQDLCRYLTFDEVCQVQDMGACTREQWDQRDEVAPFRAATGYLPHAWVNVNKRSVLLSQYALDHLSAWLWLIGYGQVVDQHWQDAKYLGKKQLIIGSILFNVDWTTWDDGRWYDPSRLEVISNEERDVETEQAVRIACDAIRTNEGKAPMSGVFIRPLRDYRTRP